MTKKDAGRKVSNKKRATVSKANSGQGNLVSNGDDGGKAPVDPDSHPFKLSSVIMARWIDDTERFCDVIERSVEEKEDGSKTFKYYVHYHDFNRRMDQWITADQVTKVPSVAAAALGNIFRCMSSSQTMVIATNSRAQAKDEEKKKKEAETLMSSSTEVDEAGVRTRRQKRKVGEYEDEECTSIAHIDHDEHEGLDEASLKEHEEVTKVKVECSPNIKMIELGRHRMETWYFSPFPKEYVGDGQIECLEGCILFISMVMKIDGAKKKIYSQNLCYLAKLFLDHKTLFYDVDPFLFYVLCEYDEWGYHPVGYFSKEKYSDLGYNLACILTFPSYQRKGYGRFLISFSYELSKKEEKVGSPEKPLSDLGLISYRSYWASVILDFLKRTEESFVSIMDLSKETSIVSEDVINTLQFLGLLKYLNGQHVLTAPKEVVRELSKKYPVKEPRVVPEKLHWAPLITDVKRDKWSIKSKRPAETST